jgi:hypothetical protein
VHKVCLRSESEPCQWCFSSSQANPGPKAKVADPIPGMIVAINLTKYLQAYHMYRAEALSTISTNVTESRMKTAVKTKATRKKTNNQASFGGGRSILKANIEVEAAIQLAHDLDETGMPCVCIGVGLLGASVLLDVKLPERI